MMAWPGAFVTWWQKRRRFAREWAFHREMAVSELESLGISRREAEAVVRRRMGSRSAWRKAALQELRADYRSLRDAHTPRHLARSPLAAPAMVLLILVVLFAVNPERREVMQSFTGLVPFTRVPAISRFIPLSPRGVVPTQFAALSLWSFAVIGIAHLLTTPKVRRHWRLWWYAGAMLMLDGALGMAAWATSLQFLLGSRWPSDLLQGAALTAFVFLYGGLVVALFRFWRRDLMQRCPVCLRTLGMPAASGNAHDVLIAPFEIETICLGGDGSNVESRWRQSFQANDPHLSPI